MLLCPENSFLIQGSVKFTHPYFLLKCFLYVIFKIWASNLSKIYFGVWYEVVKINLTISSQIVHFSSAIFE